MYVVREVFTAKPGNASKLAKLFKEIFGTHPRMKARVMTDAVGEYNTVVMEIEVASLSAFEEMMSDPAESAKFQEKMKGYTEMYLTGRREVYKVV